MRVLHFWDGRRGTPKRLQIDFVKKLSNHCTLHVYGKNEDNHNSKEVSPIPFKGSRDIQSVVEELNSDILLIPEHAISKGITGLRNCKIPVVMMELDYYVTKEAFYENNNIKYIVTRAPITFEDQNIESVYLPFSVDDKEFYTDIESDYLDYRKNKIAFVGSGPGSKNVFYRERIEAINILNKCNFFKFIGLRQPKDYTSVLKEFIGALSCSFSDLKMPPAKVWEIMACGCALLVSDFHYRKLLFGEECMFIYKKNLSDIENVAKEIVSDLDKVSEYTKRALSVIQKQHLDSHRIYELYNILKAIKEGKEIPKVWGF